MADYLVTRAGMAGRPRLLPPLPPLDRQRAFAAAFGQPVEAFEAEVLRYLKGLE